MSEKKEEPLPPFITSDPSKDHIEDDRFSSGLPVEPSGGFHPGEGEYVIDPDYMEILDIDSPEGLIRHYK